jgi:hypothetical protein
MIYTVTREWYGYSRGFTTYKIEADSEEDAVESYCYGEEVSHQVVRDDTETQEITVSEEVEEQKGELPC